ncbi:TsoY family (seleno)protein [Malaciobacter marinus]|jgi:hypothetical protein|uniref:TsoY family (seleno)protein n=1 Tax=Malaciobacter marinus TaxID=505249 RepID=UPI000C0775DA|nr:hypothetical protein [Malaciobacter marinus]PHO11504.1 hypothetical protein CPG38_12690 [Malaciobacter marinus]
MAKVSNLGEKYTPMYFLASLGSGGLAVSFFLYLNFLIPHKGVEMVSITHIMPFLQKGNFVSFLIAIAILITFFFIFKHFELLFWNIKEYGFFKKSIGFEKLKRTNSEVSLMAIPLTIGMSMNIVFILLALTLPILYDVIEYLLPVALVSFLVIGFFALKIYIEYFSHMIISGDFKANENNNFSQLIAIFAFAMISVGFSGPGAMSSNITVSSIGIFFAVFFAIVAISLTFIKIILAMREILESGISKETSVSIWIMLPILTLLNIAFIRLTFGFYHHLVNDSVPSAWLFLITSSIFSLELIFAVVGYFVMKKLGYFKDYINGDKKSNLSFAIICPGVAFYVLGFFFIMAGLVKNNIITIFSPQFFIILAILVFVQYKTVRTFFKLEKKLIKQHA